MSKRVSYGVLRSESVTVSVLLRSVWPNKTRPFSAFPTLGDTAKRVQRGAGRATNYSTTPYSVPEYHTEYRRLILPTELGQRVLQGYLVLLLSLLCCTYGVRSTLLYY